MPREVSVWQRTLFDDDYEVCPHCNGWGGRGRPVCRTLGGPDDDWLTCYLCYGQGQVLLPEDEDSEESLLVAHGS